MEIKQVMEHYEVYDDTGKFLFSADTKKEINDEMQKGN